MTSPLLRRRTVVALPALGLLGLPALTACGAGADGPAPSTTSISGAGATAAASTGGGVTRTVATAGAVLDVTVGPAWISADRTVVPVEVTLDQLPPDEDEVKLGLLWNGLSTGVDTSGLRLLDLTAGTVRETAWTRGDSADLTQDEPTITVHAVFDAVDALTVDVLIPQAGLFTGVPVQTGDRSEDTDATDHLSQTTWGGQAKALETYTAAVDNSSDTRTTQDQVTVNLSADVLFAVDSSELGPDADATLTTAATEISRYTGGTLTITGYTDDNGTEEHNQTLSEDRAASVRSRLEQLTDLAPFTVSTAGKGETEPRVPNDSDANRQLNRRVEIVLVPTGEATDAGTGASATSTAGSDGLPDPEGPVGAGPEGLTVTRASKDGEAVFTLDHVIRRGGFLVGEIQVTGGTGGSGSALGDWLKPVTYIGNARGKTDSSLVYAASGLSLLAGPTRYYPVDYASGESQLPVSELMLKEPLSQGETTTVTVVWPDTGQDTVVMDLQPATLAGMSNPFRLTDVPVVEG